MTEGVNGVCASFSSLWNWAREALLCNVNPAQPMSPYLPIATMLLSTFLGAQMFTSQKQSRWECGRSSKAKESLRVGWMQGGKVNSLLLTTSSLTLHCPLISHIPIEKSRLKTQVVKTLLFWSTSTGGNMAARSRSGVEWAFSVPVSNLVQLPGGITFPGPDQKTLWDPPAQSPVVFFICTAEQVLLSRLPEGKCPSVSP